MASPQQAGAVERRHAAPSELTSAAVPREHHAIRIPDVQCTEESRDGNECSCGADGQVEHRDVELPAQQRAKRRHRRPHAPRRC
jgi:hypothetical protein